MQILTLAVQVIPQAGPAEVKTRSEVEEWAWRHPFDVEGVPKANMFFTVFSVFEMASKLRITGCIRYFYVPAWDWKTFESAIPSGGPAVEGSRALYCFNLSLSHP